MRLIKFDKKENNRTNSSNNVLWLIPIRFMVRMYILLLLNINSKYNETKTKMWDNVFKNNCFQNLSNSDILEKLTHTPGKRLFLIRR